MPVGLRVPAKMMPIRANNEPTAGFLLLVNAELVKADNYDDGGRIVVVVNQLIGVGEERK